MEIKNILIPVDFSPPATLAVNYGVALARRFRARVTLLHVLEPLAPLTYIRPAEADRINQERFEQSERLLSALLAPEDEDDLDLKTLVRTGVVQDEILAAIRGESADLVVMGTHGRGLIGRLFIGSVTQHLLREITVPILTVCKVDRPLALSRIIFATNLSDASMEGFRFVRDVAKTANAQVTVVHSIEPTVYAGPEIAGYLNEDFIEATEERLKAFAVEASKGNLEIQTKVEVGLASERLFKAVDDEASDLIAITIQKKGLLERALLGTTAERVIREARVPVLSIPVGPVANSAAEVHPESSALPV
jgi:nucleotide-binding universal stress UspA family protein